MVGVQWRLAMQFQISEMLKLLRLSLQGLDVVRTAR
jgi:hypothetical protein